MHFNLAFIGFGTVGQGLTKILLEKKDMLVKKFDFNWTVVAVSDIKKGSIYNENGLDMKKILQLVKTGKKLDEYSPGVIGMDSINTITKTNADTIIEVTFTDVKTGEPAITHIKTALNAGKNVISTNKGPVVKHAIDLLELANSKNVHYGSIIIIQIESAGLLMGHLR